MSAQSEPSSVEAVQASRGTTLILKSAGGSDLWTRNGIDLVGERQKELRFSSIHDRDSGRYLSPSGQERFDVEVVKPGRLDDWRSRLAPVAAELSGLVFEARGVGVAVGRSGTIVRKPVGGDWGRVESGTHQHLYAVAVMGERYLAVGREGVILRSDDGINWVRQVTGSNEALYGVAATSEVAVAVGRNGTLLRSKDGEQWEVVDSGTRQHLRGIELAGPRWVAVGSGGVILSSADGSSWEKEADSGSNLRAIAFGGGHYLAVGNGGKVRASTDGRRWNFVTDQVADTLRAVRFLREEEGEPVFAAVGSGGQWYQIQIGRESLVTKEAAGELRSIYDLSVGQSGLMVVGRDGRIFENNGEFWVRSFPLEIPPTRGLEPCGLEWERLSYLQRRRRPVLGRRYFMAVRRGGRLRSRWVGRRGNQREPIYGLEGDGFCSRVDGFDRSQRLEIFRADGPGGSFRSGSFCGSG
ncbi:MAG: hypothetical protein AAF514_13985 [Verrucomicrobiota bacterium]